MLHAVFSLFVRDQHRSVATPRIRKGKYYISPKKSAGPRHKNEKRVPLQKLHNRPRQGIERSNSLSKMKKQRRYYCYSSRNVFGLLLMAVAMIFDPMSICNAVRVFPRRCKGSPKHIHIAVGEDPTTQMTITFATKVSRACYGP